MDKVLVAGIETVVGGNLASYLSDHMPVAGVALTEPVTLGGCDIDSRIASSPEMIQQVIDRIRPTRIVLCGSGARPGWNSGSIPKQADVDLAAWWTEAASQVGAQFTLISSDAVFTGPWMFHAENSHSICPSEGAECLRTMESNTLEACPEALVVRTHAFGWQPGGKPGWIETLLSQLERGSETELDCVRYASPILATDLAEIIQNAWSAGLNGIYHVAGAERVNPVQFASRLANQFHLPIPLSLATESLIDRPSGFGCGETSLQTRKIRRALGLSMPMLDEGLVRLFQQNADGFRNRLSGHSNRPTSRVA